MTKRQHAILALSIPLLIYVSLVCKEAYWHRDQINPDAIAYVRNAQYIVGGQFHKSVSGYWSPLLSWCIVPLRYVGLDGLHSARIALAIWGGVLVLASYGLLRSLAPRSLRVGLFALSLIAVVTARQATCRITPDLPMFALLLAYCAITSSTRLLQDKRLQSLSGVLGALAYLAKSYALPFFLMHFTFTVVLRSIFSPKPSLRQAVAAWGVGILACSFVCGPWIGVLSCKHGKPTFSTVASVAHTIIGPGDRSRCHSSVERLYDVDDGRLSINETPEARPYKPWSPFENRVYFAHQAKYTVKTGVQILGNISNYDMFRISIPALVFLPVLLWLLGWKAAQLRATWVMGTVAIFSAGFTLVYYTNRYTFGFLWPLCCMYVVGFGSYCFRRIAARLKLPSYSSLAISTLLIASFAATCAWESRSLISKGARPGVAYRTFGQELKRAGCTGPIAATKHVGYKGMFVAYHMDEPFLGCPAGESVAAIEAALEEFGVTTFLVSGDDDASRQFRQQTSWHQQLAIPLEQEGVFVYVPPNPDGSPRGCTNVPFASRP